MLSLIYLMNTKVQVTIRTPVGETQPFICSNINSIQLKKNELLKFHAGRYGNKVCADAFHPKEAPYQI